MLVAIAPALAQPKTQQETPAPTTAERYEHSLLAPVVLRARTASVILNPPSQVEFTQNVENLEACVALAQAYRRDHFNMGFARENGRLTVRGGAGLTMDSECILPASRTASPLPLSLRWHIETSSYQMPMLDDPRARMRYRGLEPYTMIFLNYDRRRTPFVEGVGQASLEACLEGLRQRAVVLDVNINVGSRAFCIMNTPNGPVPTRYMLRRVDGRAELGPS